MLSNAPIVIIDIDGVVADNTKRLKHIVVRKDGQPTANREAADWRKYTEKYKKDKQGLASPLLKLLIDGNPDLQVMFLTARRDLDSSVFHVHKFIGENKKHLVVTRGNPMWDIDPNLPAPEFKLKHVQRLHELGLNIVGFFDDSVRNCYAVQQALPDVPVFRFLSHVRLEDYYSDRY